MMNPLYNCRTYFVNGTQSLNKIFSDIAYDGANIQGTREFVNTRIVVPKIDKGIWGLEYQHVMLTEQLIKAIQEQDENMINDVYDSKHYVFLKSEMESVKAQFKNDCVATRRAVFQFPATHCLDSIQIMIRDAQVITTVNMRSCNAYKNLVCDLYLADRLAYEVTRGKPVERRHLVANIGSLHLFKEDIKNVL